MNHTFYFTEPLRQTILECVQSAHENLRKDESEPCYQLLLTADDYMFAFGDDLLFVQGMSQVHPMTAPTYWQLTDESIERFLQACKQGESECVLSLDEAQIIHDITPIWLSQENYAYYAIWRDHFLPLSLSAEWNTGHHKQQKFDDELPEKYYESYDLTCNNGVFANLQRDNTNPEQSYSVLELLFY